jgi:histidinol phosphatase-like PHP family hydrolase
MLLSEVSVIFDFHTHTFSSDGVLSPLELVRYALIKGYQAIALTDHVGLGTLERVIKETTQDCALARAKWDILAIPGVELTHMPPSAIAEAARQAKELGAWLVVVHGETTTEPVEEGTNLAALQCPDVDILAHPGLLTLQEAELAAESGIFIELSARKGHCLSNPHIASIALKIGARLLIDSDAHEDGDLLTPQLIDAIVQGAGLSEDERHKTLSINPRLLLEKLPRLA